MDAVVVGYGSIGRWHVQTLQARARRLAIVDSNQTLLEQVGSSLPSAVTAGSLSELAAMAWPWESTLAVIATWGPSHAGLFHEFVRRGVRYIVCEKPLANSVAAASAMVQRAEEAGVALAVNHLGRYMGRARGVKRLAGTYGLGSPRSMVVCGGASGLVTNGVHLIDFACELFESNPQSVVSTARGEPINPRSPDLEFYGGSAIWSFGDGKEAIFSFSNQSSVAPQVHIYYQHATMSVDIRTNSVTVLARPRSSIENLNAITRLGPADQELYSGPIPGVIVDIGAALSLLYDDVASGRVKISPASVGLTALGACIGALTSSAIGRVIHLPIASTSRIGRKEWPFT